MDFSSGAFLAQVCVPNWPCFNRRPITWRPAVGADEVTCEEYAEDAAAVAAANAERIAQNIAAKIKERSKAK
jgi:hypothetical protein